jgi:hypothetical protein
MELVLLAVTAHLLLWFNILTGACINRMFVPSLNKTVQPVNKYKWGTVMVW